MNEFDFLKEAKDKMTNEQYNKVISLCNMVLKINNKLSEAYSLRGNANYYLNNCKDAVEDFSKAINWEPNIAKYYCDRSEVYFQINNLEDAIIDINKAIEIEPKTPIFYHEKSIYEYYLGRYKEAIVTLSNGINLEPTENQYIKRACCFTKLEQYDLAFADLNSALEINPESNEAYYRKGIIKSGLGNYNDAISDFEKAFELNPLDDEALIEIGKCKAEMGKLDCSIKYINKAIKINPSEDNYKTRILAREKVLKIRQNIINLYKNKPIKENSTRNIEIFNKKQASDDIKDLTKILKINPKNVDLLVERADRYFYLKEYSLAKDDYSAVIKSEGEKSSYYYELAKTKYFLKEYSDALSDCDKFLKFNKQADNLVNIFSTKGVCNFQLAQYEACVKNLSKAIILDENETFRYYYRAIANYKLRHYISAYKDILKAIKLNNNNLEFEFEDKLPKTVLIIIGLFNYKLNTLKTLLYQWFLNNFKII